MAEEKGAIIDSSPAESSQWSLSENRWDPKLEAVVFGVWDSERTFQFKRIPGKKIWTIDTPPPYASGTWHVGGAVHYSSIDIIARYKRMKGFSVNYMMGIDRNGLPIEVQTEKEYKIRMYETDRKHFLSLCKALLDKYETEILRVCKKLGCSNNSLEPTGVYRTDSPEYRAVTQATFIEMWKRGLVYQEDRPNNWCTDCGTTIADAEIEYKDKESTLLHLSFQVKDSGEKLTIATSRPELICACACVLVNPQDERYKKFHGKKLITPIFGKEVEIIAHPEASIEFGTGAVMVCSFGDYTDVRLFRSLGLPVTKAISPDGKMTDAAGQYSGLRIGKARQAITEDLEKEGYVVKSEKIVHRGPVCWRSKTSIEFVSMPEFYLKQKDYVESLLASSMGIRFHPESSRQILEDWLASVTLDWPISRRRYYGTELPIWYCLSCGEAVLPEPGKYYQPWQEACPAKECPKCKGADFSGEKRTFDTWFDSSISELIVAGYSKDPELFKESFPVSVRPQGKDIVRTWLYYTLLRAHLLFEKPAFEHVWISGHVVDEKGEKMSKSVGNVVMPEPLIDRYGADAFRFFASSEALLGSDLRFSEDRLSGSAKFIQKLYNISKFISGFPKVDSAPERLEPADEWILGELDSTVSDAEKGYENLDFFTPATKIRAFAWDLFASHYLELVKGRAYNREGKFSESAQKSAHYTLHKCLRTILLLSAPISPFVTEHCWRALQYSRGSIHLESFPESEGKYGKKAGVSEALVEFNKLCWKTKKDAQKSMKDPLEHAVCPEEIAVFGADLAAMHNISNLREGKFSSAGI